MRERRERERESEREEREREYEKTSPCRLCPISIRAETFLGIFVILVETCRLK